MSGPGVLNFYGGAWTSSSTTEYLPVVNPATSEQLAAVPSGT